MKKVSLLMMLILLVGCDLSYFQSGIVGKAIRKEVRNLERTNIELSKIIPFDWDEVYFFGPYAPKSIICERLSISNDDCEKVIDRESTDDGEMYLVFMKSGKIIHKEMYIRFNGDFTPINFKQPLTPKTAIFIVKKDGKSFTGAPWLRLV